MAEERKNLTVPLPLLSEHILHSPLIILLEMKSMTDLGLFPSLAHEVSASIAFGEIQT